MRRGSRYQSICITCSEPFKGNKGMPLRCMRCTHVAERVRNRAYRQVFMARLSGRLPELSVEHIPCVECGSRAQHWDHRDYTKPLDVQPLCRSCNYKAGPGYMSPEQIAEASRRFRWERAA